MQIHYRKHHQAYIDSLNAVLESLSRSAVEERRDLCREISSIPEEIRTMVRSAAGGHWNHSRLWAWMTPHCRRCTGRQDRRGDHDVVRQRRRLQGAVLEGGDGVSAVAGRGWSKTAPRSSVTTTPNQDNPLMDGKYTDSGPRRVGARLLLEVPEPTGRLRQGVVERRELGRSQQSVARRTTRLTAAGRLFRIAQRRCPGSVIVASSNGERLRPKTEVASASRDEDVGSAPCSAAASSATAHLPQPPPPLTAVSPFPPGGTAPPLSMATAWHEELPPFPVRSCASRSSRCRTHARSRGIHLAPLAAMSTHGASD